MGSEIHLIFISHGFHTKCDTQAILSVLTTYKTLMSILFIASKHGTSISKETGVIHN